jgi:hypothetical protein
LSNEVDQLAALSALLSMMGDRASAPNREEKPGAAVASGKFFQVANLHA